MKTLQWLAAAALAAVCVGCNDAGRAVVEPPINATVVVPGNEPTLPNCSPDPACLAPLDAAIKALYERNNRLSEPGEGTTELVFHGEARYQAASRANYHLGQIYLSADMTAASATQRLRRYVADVARFHRQGDFSDCAANQLIARANWIIDAINTAAAPDFDAANLSALVAEPTPWDCQLSPITASPGMTDAGLSLNVVDVWGFQTSYRVRLPNGMVQEFTAASFVDPSAKAPGQYGYELQQCSNLLGCSVWTSLIITVPITGEPCAHDNRDGWFVSQPGPPMCVQKK